MRRSLALISVCAITLAIAAACDDSDSSNNTSSGGGDADSFCELNFSITGSPTDEQLDQLADMAPGEIKDEVRILVNAYKADEVDAANEELNAAGMAVDTWITDNCEAPDVEELPSVDETNPPGQQE